MTSPDPRNVKDVQRKCKNCGDPFMARSADVNRGWAKFCSKSCKAREQTRRTGYAGPRKESTRERDERFHREARFDSTTSHGQWGTD